MAKLPYKVECKSSYPFYELIAAFDCEQAAYADDCYNANPKYSYHVVKGKKLLAFYHGSE
jgi:hypothetical protein